MSRLGEIAATVQQVAEAISAVLEVETEILDEELTIVAGTGKYRELIGTKDDEAYCSDSHFIYTRVLKTGQAFIIEDPTDKIYGPTLIGEIGEICCPVKLGSETIGVMGLIAFNPHQRARLLGKKEQLINFLQRMAFLLASRVSEKEAYNQVNLTSNRLRAIVESIQEGIVAVDAACRVTHCNRAAEVMIGLPKGELIDRDLREVWKDSPVEEVLKTGVGYQEKEEYYSTPQKKMHLLVTTNPINVDGKVMGAVASFRNMADVRRLAYNLTEMTQQFGFDEIKGESQQLLDAKAKAYRVAQGSSTILILAESGTGKELFARAIHYASPRRDKPLVTVNCGAIPETLLESELFGYEEGAFTGARKGGRAGKFELADGGTIFLDEIGDLPLHLQVKLLHVLQRRQVERISSNKVTPVDVRVIAATNKNLEAMVRSKEFREDLYYRLSVIPLTIPPLRERREDISILMHYFLEKHSALQEKCIKSFSHDVIDAFLAYQWPGNVRELENAIEYAVNMEEGAVISLNSVPPKLRARTGSGDGSGPFTLKDQLEQYEQELLIKYREGKHSKTHLAKALGISRATLYRKLKELDNNQ